MWFHRRIIIPPDVNMLILTRLSIYLGIVASLMACVQASEIDEVMKVI